jgi:hypothetical protein
LMSLWAVGVFYFKVVLVNILHCKFLVGNLFRVEVALSILDSE